MTDTPLLLVAFPGVFALIGLAILAQGLRKTGVLIPMIRTETSDIVSLSSGLVEIEGQARDQDDLLTAPLTGTDCVAYEVEIQEYKHTGQGANWRTVHTSEDALPFLVEDGTGEVTVDPSGATRVLETDLHREVDRDEHPPENIQSYLDGIDVTHETTPEDAGMITTQTGDRQIFVERRIDPAEETYVLGPAQRGDDHTAFTIGPTDDGTFLIGDRDEAGVREMVGKRSLATIAFGLAFTAIPGTFALYVLLAG